MKKRLTILAACTVVLGMLLMTACSSSSFEPESFGMSTEEGKTVTVEAENAAEDSTYTSDTIKVEEGEGIVMTSGVESGEIRVEVYEGTQDEISDDAPQPDGEPVMTLNAGQGDAVSGTVEPGDYFVRATVTDKATGTVTVEVKPYN